MDKDTVFVKTREGEEAFLQRTRLVQRNLRNVLIMVDGHSSVAELAQRFGDEDVTLHALEELQRSGLIEKTGDSLDFASADTLVPEPAAPLDEIPLLTAEIDVAAVLDEPTDLNADSLAQGESEAIILSEPDYASLPPSPLFDVPAETPQPVVEQVGPSRLQSLFSRIQGSRWLRNPLAKERIEPAEFHMPPAAPPAPAQRQPGSARRIRWPFVLATVSMGAVLALVLMIGLYPYDRHLPPLEKQLAQRFQEPVAIRDLKLALFPRPHLVLRHITVGKDGDLSIAQAQVHPDFLTLMGEHRVVRELVLEGVEVKSGGLETLLRAAPGSSVLEIHRVTLKNLTVNLAGTNLTGLKGECQVAATGAIEAFHLDNDAGTLSVHLQPQADHFRFTTQANLWTTPFHPQLTFQHLEVEGRLQASRVVLDKIDGRAYEGLIEGHAALDWHEGVRLDGQLELKHVSAAGLLGALGSKLLPEGEVDAQIRLDANAQHLSGLKDAVQGDGVFAMQRGTLKGLDLAEAARSIAPIRGGETSFEEMRGTLHFKERHVRLDTLRLSSGLLSAGGTLDIAAEGPLNGDLEVVLRSSAMTRRVRLKAQGLASDPVLVSVAKK